MKIYSVKSQEFQYDPEPSYSLYIGENKDKALELYRKEPNEFEVITLEEWEDGNCLDSFNRRLETIKIPLTEEEIEFQNKSRVKNVCGTLATGLDWGFSTYKYEYQIIDSYKE